MILVSYHNLAVTLRGCVMILSIYNNLAVTLR